MSQKTQTKDKMSKKNRIAIMTKRGIMVDYRELNKLGPVGGAIEMFKDLLGDILDEESSPKRANNKDKKNS